MTDRELYHFGVKGMKWGIRKKHETSDAKKSSPVKKFAKRGAVVATTLLAAYGGYKVNEFLESCTFTVNGKKVSRKEFSAVIKTVVRSLR